MSFSIVIPNYLPDVRFFTFFVPCKYMLIADHLQYQKRSPVTRCNLTIDSKLTVPVLHNGFWQTISTKQIATNENWNIKHLKRIHHQFHNLPYFEEYYSGLLNLYKNYDENLVLFLESLLIFFLQKLKISTKIIRTSTFEKTGSIENLLSNFSKANNQDTFYFKKDEAAAGWLNINEIEKNNLTCIAFNIATQSKQANMNILEFLFTFGPEASFLLRETS